MNKSQEVQSTFQKRPAYRYLRVTDKLPVEVSSHDDLARVKLFNPTGAATWWIAAYDPDTQIAQGVVDLGIGFPPSFGDIWMPELVEFRGRFNLPIERDLHWTPKPIKDVMNPLAKRSY